MLSLSTFLLLCPVCRSEARVPVTGIGAAPGAAVPAVTLLTAAAAVAAAPVHGASCPRAQAAARRRRAWRSACPSHAEAAPWSPVAVHAADASKAADIPHSGELWLHAACLCTGKPVNERLEHV